MAHFNERWGFGSHSEQHKTQSRLYALCAWNKRIKKGLKELEKRGRDGRDWEQRKKEVEAEKRLRKKERNTKINWVRDRDRKRLK